MQKGDGERRKAMQFVRIIKNDNTEELLRATQVSINFKDQKVMVWNGCYWEETPFSEVFVVATFDANPDYKDR